MKYKIEHVKIDISYIKYLTDAFLVAEVEWEDRDRDEK